MTKSIQKGCPQVVAVTGVVGDILRGALGVRPRRRRVPQVEPALQRHKRVL